MKAISLWQFWATAMAVGAKQNETRGRKTNIRGDVVICSTRQRWELSATGAATLWSLRDLIGGKHASVTDLYRSLSLGQALCVLELHDCVPTESFHINGVPMKLSMREASLGDYSSGRYAWLTRNCRRFAKPFPVRGWQGWFDVPDELVRAALNP